MPIIRSDVVTWGVGDIPADYVENTVYHDIADVAFDPLFGGPDPLNHANEVMAAFAGTDPAHHDFTVYQDRQMLVKVYNMADAEPRQPLATVSRVPAGGGGAFDNWGAPQIALCLSYYPSRNLAGSRGRLFIGPHLPADLHHRPADTLIHSIMGLGDALWNVGGENVHWVLHHQGRVPENHVKGTPIVYENTLSGHPPGSTEVINHYWCDDAWDVIRRRRLKATKRVVTNH